MQDNCPLHEDEAARQQAVDDLDLLSARENGTFARVPELVRMILQLPISFFSVIDRDRQIFPAASGAELEPTPRSTAFCARTILGNRMLVVPDTRADPDFANNPLVTGPPHIRFYAGAPVHAPNGMPIGSLCAIDLRPHDPAKLPLRALELLRDNLEDALLLWSLSARDHLTGLFNRGYAGRHLAPRLRAHYRHLLPVSFVMIDIDHFKPYNDQLGHDQGDRALREVARILHAHIRRAGDLVLRQGGEEFAAVLTHSDPDSAGQLMQRIHDALVAADITHPGSPLGRLSVSAGIHTVFDEAALDTGLDALLAVADRALYAAKAGGRNRSVHSSSLPGQSAAD